jgi:hypothetical protein
MNEELTDRHMHDALMRIASTSDGVLFHRYLQKILCAVTVDNMADGALRRNEGRRTLAAELMSLMADGIRASGRTDSPVVTFALAGARTISRTRGAGRRVTPDSIVAGWNTADTITDPDPFSSASSNGSGES